MGIQKGNDCKDMRIEGKKYEFTNIWESKKGIVGNLRERAQGSVTPKP